MQLVINPETVSAEVMATAENIRSEYVVEVTGLVEAREQANPKLAYRSSRTQSGSYYGSQYCKNYTI